MSVDFPRPDSPVCESNVRTLAEKTAPKRREKKRTDDHRRELEALPHTLPVHLVGQIGETNVAHQFFAHERRNGDVRCRTV